MKKLLVFMLSILLLSCSKEDTPKQIEGDWYFTRVVIHYNNESPYVTTDYSWSDVQYTNTDSKIYVGENPMSYTVLSSTSLYIIDIDKNASIEYLDTPRDGFELSVLGNNQDTTIDKIVYSYRRKK